MKLFRNGLAFGHIIECFDNTLYGFFSILLAPIFFQVQTLLHKHYLLLARLQLDMLPNP